MHQRKPRERKIAYAQLIKNHPALNENKYIRKQYFDTLSFCCNNIYPLSRYSRSVLSYYDKLMNSHRSSSNNQKLSMRLKIILLLDILNVFGYDRNQITVKFVKDFHLNNAISSIMENLFSRLTGDNPMWDQLIQHEYMKQDSEWISRVRQNVYFSEKKPFKLLITATMSAGKSTFINAIVGKKIAKTQNLACTGRIHHIYSKPFEDGLIGKWDDDPVLDASETLLDADEENKGNASYESAFFLGGLQGRRCELLDTPGVNSSQFSKHEICTRDVLLTHNYHAIIFLINYEHDSTNDEKNHLSFLLKNVPSETPILFVINKIDSKMNDDLPLAEMMRDKSKYLESLGVRDPILFLVSSKAAYLYHNKDFLEEENEIEEWNSLKRKFNRSLNLINVYDEIKPPYIDSYSDSFEYQCGIGFIEDHIKKLIDTYERND